MSEEDLQCCVCKCGGDEIEYLISCRACEGEKIRQFCKQCCRKHLKESPDHSQGMAIFCQECEEVEIEATFYCGSCGQNLCTKCDQRIHNKCKRAKHTRQQLNLQRDLLIEIIIIIDENLAEVINSKKVVYDGFIDKLQKKRIKCDRSSLVVVFRNTCEEILNFDLNYQWEQFERSSGLSEKFLNTLKFMPQLTTCVFFQTQQESYTAEKSSLSQLFPNVQVIFTKLPISSPSISTDQQIILQQNQQQMQHLHQVQQQIQHMFPINQQIQIKQSSINSKAQQQQLQQAQPWSNQNQQEQQPQPQLVQMQQQPQNIPVSQQNPQFIGNNSFTHQQGQCNQPVQFCQAAADKNNTNLNSNGNIQNQIKTSIEESKNSQNNSAVYNPAEEEQVQKADSKSVNGSQICKKKYGNKSLNTLLNPSNSQNIDKKNSQFQNKNQSFDDGFQIYSSSESHSNEGNPPSNLNSKFLLSNNSNMNNSQNNSNLSNNNIFNNNNNIITGKACNSNSLYNNSVQQINQQNIVGDNSGIGNNSLLRNNQQNSNLNIQNTIGNTNNSNNLNINNNTNSPNSNIMTKQASQRPRNNSSNHKHSQQTNSNNITNPQLDYGNINSSINNTNNSLNQFHHNNSNNNNILSNQITNITNQALSKNTENTSRSSIHSAKQPLTNTSANNNKNSTSGMATQQKQKKSKKASKGSSNTSCNRLSRNTSSGSIRNLNTSKGSIDGGTNNILNNSLNQGLNKNASSGALEVKSKNSHNTYTCGMPFQQFQNPKTVSVKNQQIAIGIQKQLSFLAEKGELMIHKEVFLKMVQNNIPGCTEKDCVEIFNEAENAGIIHQTTRTFANSTELHFVSLKLEYISLQSLIWIIKSIKQDLMTPTDKLILSRIKECFGLKLTPKSWDMILNHLQHPSYIQNYQNGQNGLDLPQLVVQKVNDPLMGADTTVIYMKGQEWIPEDKGRIDFENDKMWKLFKEFLDQYFKQPIQNEGSDDNKSNSSASSKKNSYFTTKITKSSKKQQATNQSNSTNQQSQLNSQVNSANIANVNASINTQSQQELRAIPGGRYGCVQYVKYCGPRELQELSLGRLSLFVQEAINTGIIRYHRTLLVKHAYNEENSVLNESSSVFSLENSVHILEKSAYGLQRDVTVKHLQDALLEILQEYPKGVSLVQIPQYLKKKVYFQFNLQDLGFPKLKNFIQTMNDKVQIELAGTNNSYAILKCNTSKSKCAPSYLPESNMSDQSCTSSPLSTNNQGNLAQINDQNAAINQINRQVFGFTQSYGGIGQNNQQQYVNQQNQQYCQDFQNAILQTQNGSNSEQNQKQAAIVIEKLNELLEKVKQNIEAILKQNPNGIHIKDLYSALSKSMGVNFQFGLFGSMDFLGFLTSYAESIIDIECKQNYYVIYQKNHRFGNEGKINGNSGNPTSTTNNNKLNYNNNFQAQMIQMNNLAGNVQQFQHPQFFQEFSQNPNLINFQNNYMNLTSQNMMNFLQQTKVGNSQVQQLTQQQQLQKQSPQTQQSTTVTSNSKKRSMAISQSASNIFNNVSSSQNGSNISSNNQNSNTSSTNFIQPPTQFNSMQVGPQQSPQQQFFINQQQQQFLQNPSIIQQQYIQTQLAQQYQLFGYAPYPNNPQISPNMQSNQFGQQESPQHVRSLSQHSNNKNTNSNPNLTIGSAVRQNNTSMTNQASNNNNYINNNQNPIFHYHPHNPQYLQQHGAQFNSNNGYFTPFYQVDISQYQSTHSRNPSKSRQKAEQSSMDIKENIGLLEDILQDTDDNYSFRTQTDKTFMGDDNLTSFNWSISILNPHYQSDRQREISTEFEQFPCDLSKITNKGGGSGSGGYQNLVSSAVNERITTSGGNSNGIKNNGINLLPNYQQQGGISSYQNVLSSTPNSQQQQQQQYMNYFVNPQIYSSSNSYLNQNVQQFNTNNSFTRENNSERKF
ncbi:hypothetical protein ABPG74_012873 [Tetrahymena malaccensis]